ncbi:MAG: aldehyde dehydrogenase family protein [Myxococcaceae bacterium]|jgi:acyl-CoA reductase-like NAD-dependent aldehyde dehydrogenase|nr:aldehyde dehydrogenase family protein [Myxococcaceae bacterium]MCA3014214.1 aldehyde dehydrogenase family protein [Myxococcaceae bacterium]
MPTTRPLLLEGRFVEGESWGEVRAPFDGRLVATVAQASAAQAERALSFASASRARLAVTSAGARRRVLEGVIEGLGQRREAFVEAIVHEAGKPVSAARVEVSRAIETFTLAAAELSRFGGETVPVDLFPGAEGVTAEVRRVPAGVVLGLVPFNFPLNLGAHKVAPALAVGSPIVVKPPPQAPSAMLMLGALALEAGADPGAVQVLPCAVSVAELLVADARVRVLSFTGSSKVGWHLKARAAGRVVLELGGNAAAIVRHDASVARAAARLALGGFANAGQVCIKVQRIVVEAPVFDAFQDAFLREVDRLPVGDPAAEATVVGPLIDEASARRVEAWVDEAVARGATVLRRGARRGAVLPPIVLTHVPRDAKVYAEEVFGPVVVLERVASLDEAISAVNDSRYGLQAALFTDELSAVRRAFAALEVGGLVVNDAPSFRSDNMPYGGVKGSGLGREGVRYAMHAFSEERVLVVSPG